MTERRDDLLRRVVNAAADGGLAAFAQHTTPDPSLRFEAFGPVDPSFEGRGLGSAIIDWTESQTRSRIGEEHPSLRTCAAG